MSDQAMLIARLFLGIPFVIWGWQKLRGGEAHLIPVLKAMGLPDAKVLAYLVGLCELVGGLAITLGYPARTGALLLGLWCLLTGYVSHRDNQTDMLTHITMAGGYFVLAVAGAGTIALFGGHPTGLFAILP